MKGLIQGPTAGLSDYRGTAQPCFLCSEPWLSVLLCWEGEPRFIYFKLSLACCVILGESHPLTLNLWFPRRPLAEPICPVARGLKNLPKWHRVSMQQNWYLIPGLPDLRGQALPSRQDA